MRLAAILVCLGALVWLLWDDGDRVRPTTPQPDATNEAHAPVLLGVDTVRSRADKRNTADSTVTTRVPGAGDEADAEADADDWLSLRIDTVDAQTDRGVPATWNVGTGRITSGPFPPGMEITDEARERQRKYVDDALAAWWADFLPSGETRLDVFHLTLGDRLAYTVRPPNGYVLPDAGPYFVRQVAAGVEHAAIVVPLWREAVLDVRVLDMEGQPARDVGVYRLVAAGRKRAVRSEVRGPGRLRLRGIPHMPGEPVRAVLEWGTDDGPEEEIEVEELEEDEDLPDAHVVTTIPEDASQPWQVVVHLKSKRGPEYGFVETDNDLDYEETFGLSDASRPKGAPASVRARVLAWDGRPIVGAELWGGVTDARGEVLLAERPPGRRRLLMGLPGRFPARQMVEFVSGKTTGVTLREPSGVRLEVLVTDFHGQPRPSARIEIRDRMIFDVVDGVQRLDTYTDARGRRTFQRVEPGKATIVVATWGSRRGVEKVDLVDGETKRVTVIVP